jgi:uncharacterized protein (DUF2147 family)
LFRLACVLVIALRALAPAEAPVAPAEPPVTTAEAPVAPAEAPVATPLGVWEDASGRVRVEIKPCEDRLCGTIVWFQWPNDAQGLPLVDLRNRNPALRTRPVMGLEILRGLRPTGEGTWGDGKLYNPDDGQSYQVSLTIQDDGRLRLRAFVLLPLFGKTRYFTRVR